VSDLATRLRQTREQAGLSLYDVERRTSLNFSTIGKYERGERTPSLGALRELARAYQVPVAQLITDVCEVSDLLSPAQYRAIELLEDRPELARLLEAAESLSPGQADALTRFLQSVDWATAPRRLRG